MDASDASAALRGRAMKRCSQECSMLALRSCSSTANVWQLAKAPRKDQLKSPQQHKVSAYPAMQQSPQLPDAAAAPDDTQPQPTARTQHLLRLLILLRTRRQLRSTNTAPQQQQHQQFAAAPMWYYMQPLADYNLAVALSRKRVAIDQGLQHLRTAATLLTASCDSSHAEAALAAAEATLFDSIQRLGVAKAAAVQQLAAQLHARGAAAAAAEVDHELQDTCCPSMTCRTAV